MAAFPTPPKTPVNPPPGSSGTLLGMLLSFLAGAGLKPVSEVLNRLAGSGRGSLGGDVTRPHKAGAKIVASSQPGVQVAPSAQSPAGLPPGGQPGVTGQVPPALLQRLLMLMKLQQQ
jgi:hypothetical protein